MLLSIDLDSFRASTTCTGTTRATSCCAWSANLPTPPEGPAELEIARAIGRLLHVSDAERLDAWRAWVASPAPPALADLDERRRRLLGMLLESVEPRPRVGGGGQAGLDRLWSHPALLGELAEVLERLDVDARDVTMPVRLPHGQHVPIHAHARYTRNEILASFGHSVLTRPLEWREGVRYDLDAQTDLFAFTLQKAERDFSPTTMYRDYAISRDLVHWESQSTLTEGTPTARRYMQHATAGTSILLFARPTKNERAFTCLGMATHVEHRGERPIAFVWRLDQPMLESFFAMARADVA